MQVLQKGYQLHDRMLRPSRVVVARAPSEGEQVQHYAESLSQAGEGDEAGKDEEVSE